MSCSPDLARPVLLDEPVRTRDFVVQAVLVLGAVPDALRGVGAVHLAVAAAVLDALLIAQAPL